MLQICTVNLEILIKNYAVSGLDTYFRLGCDSEAAIIHKTKYLGILAGLLSSVEEKVVETIRKEFSNGNAKPFLNKEDYEQILKMKEEGQECCIRILFKDETLCILSKKEIA